MTKLHIPALLIPNPPHDPDPIAPPKQSDSPKDVCFGTQNWGPGGHWRDFADMISEYQPLTLAFQEVGDQRLGVEKVCAKTGYGLINGHSLPGQSSTVTLWNKRLLTLGQQYAISLHLPATIKTNTGGHMRLKHKWYIGGHFRHKKLGTKFISGSVHWVYNQDMEPNGHIALETSHNFVNGLAGFHDLLFSAGDYNANVDSKHLAPLRAAGYHSARETIHIQSEHGTIDDLKWQAGNPPEQRGNRFRPTHGKAVRNSSDHDGIIIWGEII